MSAPQEMLATACWDALVVLLRAQLERVDVQPITDKDFDQQGQLVLTPPSVRVFYAGTGDAVIDSQATSYESTHRFLVACGDQDRRGNYDQARASLLLAERARRILAGARLQLGSDELTEPVILKANETLPVKALGVAYGVAIEVPGPAGYPGANAWPVTEGATNA